MNYFLLLLIAFDLGILVRCLLGVFNNAISLRKNDKVFHEEDFIPIIPLLLIIGFFIKLFFEILNNII